MLRQEDEKKSEFGARKIAVAVAVVAQQNTAKYPLVVVTLCSDFKLITIHSLTFLQSKQLKAGYSIWAGPPVEVDHLLKIQFILAHSTKGSANTLSNVHGFQCVYLRTVYRVQSRVPGSRGTFPNLRKSKKLRNYISVYFLKIRIILTLQRPGGGRSDPRVHKFACYGRKTKKYRIRGTENALPTPHNPTYTQRFHRIYGEDVHDACGVN